MENTFRSEQTSQKNLSVILSVEPKSFSKILRVCKISARSFLWLFFSPRPVRRLTNAWMVFKAEGLRVCYLRAIENFSDIYRTYRHDRNELTPFQSQYILSLERRKPVISILTVLQPDTSVRLLKKCIDSVSRQHYENWELILLGEHNEKIQTVCNFIKAASQKDKRVRLYCTAPMTVGARLNEGIKLAAGEFIGFLGPQDELAPDALTWLIWVSNNHPDAHWFYSDEDRISAVIGRYHTPNFKPDFSTEFLLSQMYTGRFCVYSADMLLRTGGFSEAAECDPYHELALRLAEIVPSKTVIHIPRVLYHWRDYGFFNSSNVGGDCNPAAACNTVSQSLKRRNIKGQVTSHALCRSLYRIALEPTQFPKVSIIIPTKNAFSLIKMCIDSVRKFTNYPNYEIVIVNNASDDTNLLEYFKKEQAENGIKVINYEKPFNYSEMNNMAIDLVHSDWVVLMNNDVEIISERWLEQLVATAQIDESIASVGGLLLYPNGTVQHGGIILGIRGIAGHAHKYMTLDVPGYCGRLHALQGYSGVTAALSLIRKSAFIQVGGFNSVKYPTSFNDVDLCIRLGKAGFRCIYNPIVRAIHHESKTRPITTDEFIFRKRLATDYAEILRNDPFYNPNLSLSNEQFNGYREFPVEYQIPELSNLTQQF